MGWAMIAALALAAPAITGACKFSPLEPGAPTDGTVDGIADGGGEDAEPDDAAPDGPVLPLCDPTACEAAGGGCVAANGHCRIEHSMDGGVTCPPGHYCDILCAGTNVACRTDGVDCTTAVGCTITCGSGGEGDQSCGDGGVRCPATGPCSVTCAGGMTCQRMPVSCGAGACDVHCLGVNACGDAGVRCNDSAACTVECVGNNACRNGAVLCGPGDCEVLCDGSSACQNLPICAATPVDCVFHCCGANACGNGELCTGCAQDNVCPA